MGSTTTSTDTVAAAAVAAPADLFSGAMPKAEIGALRFLRENPQYDGRGVLVAIFDTGVDPGARGLQTTTDGKPKVLDVLDCSGSGDVDTSTEVEATDGRVTGVFGERLSLNSSWHNPSGNWRVGAKRLYQLIPRGLKSRLEKERKKRFGAQQREAVTAATAAVASFQRRHNGGSLSAAEEKEAKDLKDRLQTLKDLEDKWEDLGPMISCVVWHDGEHWRAALDTSDMFEPDSGKGLLADFEPLTNFRAERKFGTFSAEDACNFVLNIYDEGALLSIVVDAGSHGTHVAGITAAHHPEDPSLNGVAPGAQIISCKIGDSRLGSMETMTGLTRALIAALDHKADVINMSYGEATSTPNQGRFNQLAAEVVNKHGIIYVASAGNAGPALSTVGAPGGTCSACISVAAYVSPDMAVGSHAVRSSLEQGQQYTWSSRGPTYDGAPGVTLAAPGGAVAPVPQWTQQARMLMNGTSMASPNACGGVALLLSGLKASQQMITPTRVRRALENTCKPVSNAADAVLTNGRGLMQVDAAFQYLEQTRDVDQPDARYEVSVSRGDTQAQGRGIYLREPADSTRPVRFTAKVEATFHEDADTKTERLALENRLALESTQPWVTAPRALLLAGGSRTFEVEVDPRGLPEGLHFAEVIATDTAAPERGALFRVPVTVIKPLTIESASEASTATNGGGSNREPQNDFIARLGWQTFVSGVEVRRFIAVPEGASWAELRLRAGSYDANRTFLIRTTQLVPQRRFSEFEKTATVSLSGTGTYAAAFKVAAGGTLEVTLSQFWSSLGDAALEAELEFHGLAAEPGAISLDGSAGNAKLWVRAPFRAEKMTPSAKLDRLRMAVRPHEVAMTPLPGPRDALPDGRTAHAMVLTYKFSLAEDGKVTPTLPMLNRYVYDGEMEQQMYMLFDANRKLLGTGDIYPSAVQLTKGEYTLRLVLRHDSPQLLDKFRALPMILEKHIDSVTVPVYPGNSASILAAKDGPIKDKRLAAGQRAALFVGPAPEDKLPKDATPGRLLTGSLVLAKLSGAAGSGDAPGAPTFTYLVPPKKEDEKKATVKDGSEEGEEKPTPEQRLMDAVRDAKLALLKDLDDGEAYAALRTELLADGGRQLPVLQERLQRAAKARAGPDGDRASHALDAEAADAVVAAIDTTALAVHLAQKTPEEGPGAAKRKKEFDEQKSALVEALAFKLRVLLDAEDAAERGSHTMAPAEQTAAASPSIKEDEEASAEEGVVPSGGPPAPAEEEASGRGGAAVASRADSPSSSEIEEAHRSLRKWVDTAEDGKHALLHARCEARAGRLAAALKALDKAATAATEDKDGQAARQCAERRVVFFRALGWAHWARQEESRIRDAFPPAFPLF